MTLDFPSIESQCVRALSSVKTISKPYAGMKDQVQKYQAIIRDARSLGIPITQNTPLSEIVELIVAARGK